MAGLALVLLIELLGWHWLRRTRLLWWWWRWLSGDETGFLPTTALLRVRALVGLGGLCSLLGRRTVQNVGRPLRKRGPGGVDGVVDGVLPCVWVVCGKVGLLSL